MAAATAQDVARKTQAETDLSNLPKSVLDFPRLQPINTVFQAEMFRMSVPVISDLIRKITPEVANLSSLKTDERVRLAAELRETTIFFDRLQSGPGIQPATPKEGIYKSIESALQSLQKVEADLKKYPEVSLWSPSTWTDALREPNARVAVQEAWKKFKLDFEVISRAVQTPVP